MVFFCIGGQHRSVTLAETLIADLQAAAGQEMRPPPQALVLHHMELPLDCDSEGCLLSDEDKGRLARLEVLLFHTRSLLTYPSRSLLTHNE